MSPLIAFLICALAGFALLCAGVFVLAGTGWAMLAGAFSLFCAATFIRRGMTSG
ncbi:hypothetical protein [Azotobacter chroococcum]|uniref:hypothetical protein n=1 Tax=Azotobacter chroococcum TaxID=353 RepID=UPI000B7978C4|nr:hypothetical protein [Azotobacter chroococcum]